MQVYTLKVWIGDEPGELVLDELIKADDQAGAIEAAQNYPLPASHGQLRTIELRNNLSVPVWSASI